MEFSGCRVNVCICKFFLAKPTLATAFPISATTLNWPIWAVFCRAEPIWANFGHPLPWPIWAMALRIFGGQAHRTALSPDRPFAGPPFRRTALSPDRLFAALHRTAQNFALCFPSPASLHFRSFSLSGGLLVEFWWCLKHRGPEMCTFGVLRLSCEAPFSCRAEGWIRSSARPVTQIWPGADNTVHHMALNALGGNRGDALFHLRRGQVSELVKPLCCRY